MTDLYSCVLGQEMTRPHPERSVFFNKKQNPSFQQWISFLGLKEHFKAENPYKNLKKKVTCKNLALLKIIHKENSPIYNITFSSRN